MAGFSPMGAPGGPAPGGMPGAPAGPGAPPMTPPPAAQAAAPNPVMQAALAGLPMGPGVPSVFQDVSQELPHHWQMIDAATRIIKRALKTGGFYQEPEAKAHLDQCAKDLDQLVHRYSDRGAQMGPQSAPPQKTAGQIEPAAEDGDGATVDA